MRPSKPQPRRRRSLWLVHALFIGLPALLALGGYVYSLGHGQLRITLRDASASGAAIAAGLPATLRDAGGNPLVQGLTTSYGVLALDYPDFGDCAAGATGEEERWHACRTERSRWVSDLAGRIASLSLTAGGCLLRDVPLTLNARRDIALTWWLPIAGIGGPPLAEYQAELLLDLQACRVLGSR